jgi:hypothetical protein
MPGQVLKSFNLALMGRTRVCARADTWVRPYKKIDASIWRPFFLARPVDYYMYDVKLV